ncbi:MAG: hypothetical protein ISS23_03660 [Nanoarchaeota archaeon]|nr:hypothetical protein [Nanoarchaeota archaeon]
MFRFFKKRKKDEEIEEKFFNLHNSLHNSFSNIRKDMGSIGKWVSHLKNNHDNHNKKVELLDQRVKNIEEALKDLTGVWTRVQTAVQTEGLSKQTQTDSRPNSCPSVSKQEKSSEKLTIVERLKKLTLMERAIVWTLLNTDLKLSYDDISITLGKDQSTLRGQINNIKVKSEGLIEEHMDKDGKKRFYINEKEKIRILKGMKKKAQKVKKSLKVRVKSNFKKKT